MPGLTGLISDKSEQTLFSSMQNSLNHHDYALHNYAHEGVHLACVSLPHISADKVLVHSADKRYSLIFSGEIFSAPDNSKPLPQQSAVCFLEQIERNGLDAVKKLNGQFSASLHDHVSKSTYLITDRCGTQPIYYTLHNKRLLFAAEVKALLRDNLAKRIDYHSLSELFSFGHLFGNRTLFEGVHLVPPGTVLKFSNGSIEKSQYWTYPYSEDIYRPEKFNAKKALELEENLGQIFTAAIKRQSAYAQDIFVPLSGGLDSRYVAALYHHIGERNITTYTMGPDDSDDQRYGSQVAAKLGFPHSRFAIRPENVWEATSDFAYVSDGLYFISGPLQNFEPLRHYSKTKKIMAAPQMADALFGVTLARRKVKVLRENTAPKNKLDEILIEFFNLFDPHQVKQLLQPEVYAQTKGLYRQVPEEYCQNGQHPLHNYLVLLMNEHVRRCTLGGNVAANLFYQTRMLSYDHEVFDFGWHLPLVYRDHQYLYRKTFAGLFPELAKIKRQGFNLPIGASNWMYELKILENKIATLAMRSPARHVLKYYKPWNKPSYVSHKAWFRNQLRGELESFFQKDLACSEFINPTYARTLLKDHVDGKQNNAPLLWQIINLEYFFRNFM